MTKLFFLRACPIWTTAIPAETVEEIPEWIAKKLVAGGVAIEESKHQERIEARKQRKAAEAKAKAEAAKKPVSDEPKIEKKVKKGGKE